MAVKCFKFGMKWHFLYLEKAIKCYYNTLAQGTMFYNIDESTLPVYKKKKKLKKWGNKTK